jgi:ketosteroid isomerase-like protein
VPYDAARAETASGLKANERLDRWTERANAGDIEGVLALYEKGAVFFPEPGKRCQGVEEIRASLVPWFGLNPKLEMKGIHLVECGDLAG